MSSVTNFVSLSLASRPALFTVSIWSARLMFVFLHSLKICFKWAWVYTAEVNGSMCSCPAGACPNMGMLATAAAPHMEEKQLWYQHSFFCHSHFTRTFRFHYSYWMLDIKRIGNLQKTWNHSTAHACNWSKRVVQCCYQFREPESCPGSGWQDSCLHFFIL